MGTVVEEHNRLIDEVKALRQQLAAARDEAAELEVMLENCKARLQRWMAWAENAEKGEAALYVKAEAAEAALEPLRRVAEAAWAWHRDEGAEEDARDALKLEDELDDALAAWDEVRGKGGDNKDGVQRETEAAQATQEG